MRPWKNFSALASWLLRLAVLMVVVSLFLGVILAMNFETLPFYLATGFALSASMLVIGGFFNRHTVTMVAALFLLALSGYFAYHAFNGLNDAFARFTLLGAVSVYFLANGNK